MAVLSASNIIRSLALFHLTAAYFLLLSPSSITNHNLVVLLSQSFGMPHASPSLARPSALSALLAAVLTYYGLSDLAATYVHEQLATLYWSTQAPLRATFFLGLCAWSYYSRPGGMFVDRAEALRLAARKGAGENLGSGVILTWAFLEMMGWFSIWIALRDERKEAAVKLRMQEATEREKSM